MVATAARLWQQGKTFFRSIITSFSTSINQRVKFWLSLKWWSTQFWVSTGFVILLAMSLFSVVRLGLLYFIPELLFLEEYAAIASSSCGGQVGLLPLWSSSCVSIHNILGGTLVPLVTSLLLTWNVFLWQWPTPPTICADSDENHLLGASGW